MYIKELTLKYRKKRVRKADYAWVGKTARNAKNIILLMGDIERETVEKFYVLHLNKKHVIE